MSDPKRSIPGVKDASGAYLRPEPPNLPVAAPVPSTNSHSLDDILRCQMTGLARLTTKLVSDITSNIITKDTPQQLATCIKITMELKLKENEYLDGLSDEELEELNNHDSVKQSRS